MTQEQAVGVFSLIATIVCAIYAALAYHRPASVTALVTDPPERRRVPTRVIVLTALAALFFLITIAAMSQLPGTGPVGPRGEQGTAGPQGPPGIQGPPGPPLAAANSPEMKALLRSYWFGKQSDKLTSLVNTYSKTFDEWSAQEPQQNGTLMAMHRGPVAILLDIQSQVAAMAKQDLGSEVDFGLHPNFDRNHFIKVPGDEKFSDDFSREERRRTWDQYNTGKQTITGLLNRYNTEQQEADRIVRELATLKP